MSVLIVGMSHKSAPIELLERVSLDPSAAIKLSHMALEAPSVSEAAVISTCNRSWLPSGVRTNRVTRRPAEFQHVCTRSPRSKRCVTLFNS